jgi:hypothetical protein
VRADIFALENPISRSKNIRIAVSAPVNLQGFSGNWQGTVAGEIFQLPRLSSTFFDKQKARRADM